MTAPHPAPGARPLEEALEDEVHGLYCALVEASMNAGLRLNRPWEDWGEAVGPAMNRIVGSLLAEAAALRGQLAEAHREKNEALALAEGPSTLKEMACYLVEHTFARGDAETRATAAEHALAAERVETARLREALKEISEFPKELRSPRRSYGVGWAFWHIQGLARSALSRTTGAQDAG